MAIRAVLVGILLAACEAAGAANCGAQMERVQLERLANALARGAGSLALYREAARESQREPLSLALQEAVILHGRIGRAAVLAEIRDAMRHDGERSFVEFKLAHEAALLKDVSAGMQDNTSRLVAMKTAQEGKHTAPGPFLDALRQVSAAFASCDRPK